MLLKRAFHVAVLVLILPASSVGSQNPASYVEEAKRHSEAVLQRPADPCPDESTESHEVCMHNELAFVREHLDAFVEALRRFLATRQTSQKDDARSQLKALNKADEAWRVYRAQVCKLSFNYFSGGQGVIAEPATADCELRLDRAYIEQLEPLLTLQRVTK
jgi:uncharacterized protein YecT (DUF1311 family)